MFVVNIGCPPKSRQCAAVSTHCGAIRVAVQVIYSCPNTMTIAPIPGHLLLATMSPTSARTGATAVNPIKSKMHERKFRDMASTSWYTNIVYVQLTNAVFDENATLAHGEAGILWVGGILAR